MTAKLYGALGGSGATSDLYTLDPATGAATSVGPLGVALSGLAWDESTSTMFGATSNHSTGSTTKKLYTVNLTTGAATLVGSVGAVGMADLACDSAGNLFGLGTNTNLYSIDKATGAATLIGTIGHSGGICFDGLDVLWSLGAGNNGPYYTVNPATGAPTVAHSLSGRVNSSGFWDAAAVGPDGTAWGIDNNGGGTCWLVTVDLTTGDVDEPGSVSGSPPFDALSWNVPPGAPAPVAGFTATPRSAYPRIPVEFTDASTSAASWLWDFGDGSTSTDENVSHIYTIPGVYTVSLTATGPGGTDTETKVAYIHVSQPLWTVEHYQHEYVPDGAHSSTLVADGSLIQTVKPENLHFVLNLAQVGGVSTIDYEISIDAKDPDTGDPVVSHDFVSPYGTDFLLKRSDITDPIMGGMHTQVSGQDGDTPIDHVAISGKDYLHYLERRIWPYDADLSRITWTGPPGPFATGLHFAISPAADVGEIVLGIVETIRDLSANFPELPDNSMGMPSYSLQFTTDVDSTGKSIKYEISLFDTSTIFSLIQRLSQAGLGNGGFDFLMTWDKEFQLRAPELGDPMSPIFTLEVDATTHFANARSVGFTNDGPQWTHLLGLGAGTSHKQGGINKHLPASSAVFRRLDGSADFGDLKDLDILESLTALNLAFGSNPVHGIPIEVNPRDINDFWFHARPGQYVNVVYDLGFHQINSIQKIISMDCTVDTEGEETVVLTFNQFYDASDDTGISDF